MVYRAHWIRKQIFLAAFRDLFIWLHFRKMQKSIKHSHSNSLVLCSFQFIIISCCHSKTEYSWQLLHNRCEIWMEVSAVWSILASLHSSVVFQFVFYWRRSPVTLFKSFCTTLTLKHLKRTFKCEKKRKQRLANFVF